MSTQTQINLKLKSISKSNQSHFGLARLPVIRSAKFLWECFRKIAILARIHFSNERSFLILTFFHYLLFHFFTLFAPCQAWITSPLIYFCLAYRDTRCLKNESSSSKALACFDFETVSDEICPSVNSKYHEI